ncbi:MAG: ketoacyl-ACP synthase III, partial [Bacteroidota bacterium]
MAKFSVNNVKIDAIYSCVPTNKIKTRDYSLFNEAESLLFEKTTGISERRVAKENTTCSDLCYQAATNLLNDLSIDLSEIDILI